MVKGGGEGTSVKGRGDAALKGQDEQAVKESCCGGCWL